MMRPPTCRCSLSILRPCIATISDTLSFQRQPLPPVAATAGAVRSCTTTLVINRGCEGGTRLGCLDSATRASQQRERRQHVPQPAHSHLIPAQGLEAAAAVLQEQQRSPRTQALGHAAHRRHRVGEDAQAESVYDCSRQQKARLATGSMSLAKDRRQVPARQPAHRCQTAAPEAPPAAAPRLPERS